MRPPLDIKLGTQQVPSSWCRVRPSGYEIKHWVVVLSSKKSRSLVVKEGGVLLLSHPFGISRKLLGEPFYYKEKYKSLSLAPGDTLGCGSSPGSCWRWAGGSWGPVGAG